MKKNAVALRAITHADDSFAQGDVILGMNSGQFADWSADGVGMVREATAAEVARAKSRSVQSPVKPQHSRKPKTSAEPAAPPAAHAAEPESPPETDA